MSSHKHYILNKPYGYLSQFISNGQLKQKHHYLGELHEFAEGTMSVGRLDLASEGLLFLTTDGKVSSEINSRKFEKEYYVQLDGLVTEKALNQLKEGVVINVKNEDYTTLPCSAIKVDTPGFPDRSKKIRDERHGPTSWVSITIKEGKFRQVRKMTAAVGFPTLRLVRVRIGDVELKDLVSGEVREVSSLISF